MRPWLEIPGSHGFYAPLPLNVAFPATRGDLSKMDRRAGAVLAGHLRLDGAETMELPQMLNAIAEVIGIVSLGVV